MGLLSLGGRLVGAGLKRPGAALGTLDNVLTVGGLGLAGAQLPGLNSTWTKEAAADLDIGGDIEGTYNSLPFYKKLPFIGVTQEGLEKRVESDELREIKRDPLYTQAARELGSKRPLPQLGESKVDYYAAVGDAGREVAIERKTAAQEREFLSPANRYIMEMAERSRRDSINERADTRMQQMEMYKMGIDREDRRDRRDARTQLVAALVGSLDNLGSAFVSI